VGVIVFGLTQLFLPINFLRHFGYGPNTSPAYETVDQNSKFHRIQSTLRGANPLGAYLILTTTAAAVKLKNHKIFKLLFILASLITLFFTYSRSAYIGLAISLVVLYYIIKLHKHLQKKFVLICACAVIVLALGVTLLRHNSTAEDFFFHTSNTSKSSQSSNSVRFSDLSSGIKDVVKQPLGGGTGTAGPASAHNNHPARLAENYYIQIAQESGILGFVIFISINFIVGLRLWKNQDDPMAAVLFASLIGISFVNMLSHAWSDDTLSLLWWGMAGIMLSPVIIKTNKTKKINNETNKNKSTKVI
jgi:O-antigen ligase